MVDRGIPSFDNMGWLPKPAALGVKQVAERVSATQTAATDCTVDTYSDFGVDTATSFFFASRTSSLLALLPRTERLPSYVDYSLSLSPAWSADNVVGA